MAPLARPENVLKRAEELEAMEKPTAALELLYETVLSKRTRNVSLSHLEPIVVRFVELCVLLRRGKTVKDGLHQYKKLVVPANPGSLETVVNRLLEVSEKRVTQAQAAAEQIVVDDEDLEAEQTPEDLILSTVSSEQTKDRTDREVVTPWLKFLWEAYRSVLDVLRNNSNLEALYAKVVYQAFQFCLKYQRKVEFRRLCELLRNHLQMAAQQAKMPNQTSPIDLTDPDTLQLFLDTRFEQLNAAVKLELWQEAFRSVEDVHTLLTVSRRPIKISNMASYYETLARIFAVSNNHLFHAAAWAKFYSMVYHTRHSAPEGELQRIASFFLLSVLCIPFGSGDGDASAGPSFLASGAATSSLTNSKNLRLSHLLNLSRVPSRESLMATAMAKNVLDYVRPEIKDLYNLLEKDFHPLTIKSRLTPIIETIGKVKVYQPYVKALLQVITSSVFLQLSQSYTTVKLDFIVGLVNFPAPFDLSAIEVEKLLVFGSGNGDYKVRVDHKRQSVTFVDAFSSSTPVTSANSLEPTPAVMVRNQLRDFATAISASVPKVDASEGSRKEACLRALLESARDGLKAENDAFLNRKLLQEERQQKAKQLQRAREAEAAQARAAKMVAEKEAERIRIAEEQRGRENERIRRERKIIEDAAKRKLAEEINSKGVIQVDMNKLDELDADKLQRMQLEQLDKESKDLRVRMRGVARRLDHLERAYRKEEAQLWVKDAEAQAVRDKEAHVARQEAFIKGSKARKEYAQAAKSRFDRMVPVYDEYLKQLDERRQQAFVAAKTQNDQLLEDAKNKRKEEVLAERERVAAIEKEKEERLAKEAEARRQRLKEEEERRQHVYVPGALRSQDEHTPRAPLATSPAPEAASQRASPFGGARPVSTEAKAGSPFGGARPVSTEPRAGSPFGNARPVPVGASARTPATASAQTSAPKPSPFGNAKPVTSSSPFGGAKPVTTGSSPFGNAKPASSGSSPFGNAKPVSTKPSPFGNAKPVATKSASPFGAAKPVETAPKTDQEPANKPSPFGNARPKPVGQTGSGPSQGRYMPPSRK